MGTLIQSRRQAEKPVRCVYKFRWMDDSSFSLLCNRCIYIWLFVLSFLNHLQGASIDHHHTDLTNRGDVSSPLKLGGTQTMTPPSKDKICIVGSGNWGSAIATIIGRNCAHFSCFDTEVRMWVYEEVVQHQGKQRKLSELINTHHENTKYLPGIRLPENIIAEPILEQACRDATVLVFVLPHQFLPKLLPQIRKVVHPSCRCISLIKALGKSTECGCRNACGSYFG